MISSGHSDQLDNEIYSNVANLSKDETRVKKFEDLAKREKIEFDKFEKERSRGKNFRVTDIINPMQAYFEIKNPNEADPADLKRLFAYGNFVERKVEGILSKDPNFIVAQGTVYGQNCRLQDVRGRIDFRIGDCIVEFKTSEKDVPDEETILNEHPQDLEQLLLYILFTGREGQEHRLLYITGKHPLNIVRNFKVKIKDAKRVNDYFIKRRDGLKAALENSDPSGLGKCRYYGSLCKFKKSVVCTCSGESEIDINTLRNSVFIKPVSEDLDRKISQEFVGKDLSFRFWDFFIPRRWYLTTKNPFEFIQNDDGDDFKNYRLRKRILNALVEEGVMKKQSLIGEYPNLREQYYSISDNEKQYPVLIRVQDTNILNHTKQLLPIYKAQIGLICSFANIQIGYVFVFYRNSEVGVLWKVEFSKLGGIRNHVEKLMEMMRRVLEGKVQPNKLPDCVDFMKREKCYSECPCKSS